MAPRSIIHPTLIIAFALKNPVPNTIVFGAVATGSINPIDEEKVAGTINTKGSTPNTEDNGNRIGRTN